MNQVTEFFRRFHTLIFLNTYNLFQVPYCDSKKFIENLDIERENYATRSRYQYRAWVMIHGKSKMFFLNVIFFFVTPLSSLIFLFRGLFSPNQQGINPSLAITFLPDENLLTKSLVSRFTVVPGIYSYSLKLTDLLFLSRNLRLHDAPFFVFKVMLKVALYSHNLSKANADSIITASEYSFTSSILTGYCESRSVKHINVMHGEKFFFIRDSFFRFHECYIWDEHYSNIFRKLKSYPNQFIVESPLKFSEYRKQPVSNSIPIKSIKYFLDGTEQLDEVDRLADIFTECGFQFVFRPHPIFTTQSLKRELRTPIEEPNSVNIVESIRSSGFVCAKYSTVLFEAWLMGKDVIIDDLSQPAGFEALKQIDYIMLHKPHRLLSSLRK